MPKVKNNHDGVLVVAGVEVRPGATVAVDDRKFGNWAQGSTAKRWLEQEVITQEGDAPAPKEAPAPTQTTDQERAALLTEARELGLNPNANISTAKLKEQVEAKREAK